MDTVGERVKKLRRYLGLTQEEFASRIEKARNTITIAEYETGKKELSNQDISLICYIFGARPDWLKYGTGEMLSKKNSEVDEIAKKYNLSRTGATLISGYISMDPENRKTVIMALKDISGELDDIPDKTHKSESDLQNSASIHEQAADLSKNEDLDISSPDQVSGRPKHIRSKLFIGGLIFVLAMWAGALKFTSSSETDLNATTVEQPEQLVQTVQTVPVSEVNVAEADINTLTDQQIIDYLRSSDSDNSYESESNSPSKEDDVNLHDYVLNTSTKKFHRPTCRAVKRMNDENREDVTASYEDIISQGYEPCGICNPN